MRNAATVVGKDENEWAYLWQAASGAGHGQNWFGLEGFDLRPIREYEPRHFRTMSVPDPVYITEMIEAADDSLVWGTTRWLDYGGHDWSLMFTAARATRPSSASAFPNPHEGTVALSACHDRRVCISGGAEGMAA